MKKFIISTFVTLYVMVSLISTIHVIDFFKLSNPEWLAVTLAIAFEVGAAASLASIIALKKMNKTIVWLLFFTLTFMQGMGNTYYAYMHIQNYQGWSELFGMVDNDIIEQKRILSLISGAILPLVALGFIKSLVDYMKPEAETPLVKIPQDILMVNKNQTEQVDIDTLPENSDEELAQLGREAENRLILKKVVEKAEEREKAGIIYEDEPTALANSGITEIIADDPDLEEDEPEIENNEPQDENPSTLIGDIKVFENGKAK